MSNVAVEPQAIKMQWARWENREAREEACEDLSSGESGQTKKLGLGWSRRHFKALQTAKKE